MIFIMIVICAVGMDWEAQAQNFLLVAILAAIVCFIGGVIMGPKSEEEVSQGFVGLSGSCGHQCLPIKKN
jgi:solute carrier family 12 (sodium/potassium/chloride transporter), member 2